MTRLYRLERSLIGVTGPDARSFLQNLLTQDLDALDDDGVAYAALLTAQGKIVADMNVWDNTRRNGEGLVVETDPAQGADVLRRLTMYKLRANVTISTLKESFVLWTPNTLLGGLPDPRLANGALGWRSITSGDAYGQSPPGDSELEDLRIALGVPDLARDAQAEEVFAGEALLEELNGVAFDKGCFVGQENVSRMKRRATTRKKFCPIVFEGEAIPYGAPINAGAAEIGSVRTGVAGRAIALVRLDRALDATAAGQTLTAGGREIRLDPPEWLILPQREDAAD